MLKGFVQFIRQQGVVGFATGFILGTAISQIVTSLVNDILQPAIGMLFGQVNGLAALHYGSINYGKFIAAILNFVIIGAIVYFIFKQFKLDAFDAPKEQK